MELHPELRMSPEEAVRAADERIARLHRDRSPQRKTQIKFAFVYLMTGQLGGFPMLPSIRTMVFAQDHNLAKKVDMLSAEDAWAIIEDPFGLIFGPPIEDHRVLFEQLTAGHTFEECVWNAGVEDVHDLALYAQRIMVQ